ncbi:hypothetical protein N7532_006539 [Penicillium argentinense]|uniref:Uncharacterized protein n=1 Tax=Penicillium argentinense TaxID=1131581 RepID=A0A9W9KB05_9EURO|nr:uncharacterized protein N7532_006539 [Penicillium argentinense]KAJ5099538.1 hypothetical protein N7532_006539 [Penicillium argentinense]
MIARTLLLGSGGAPCGRFDSASVAGPKSAGRWLLGRLRVVASDPILPREWTPPPEDLRYSLDMQKYCISIAHPRPAQLTMNHPVKSLWRQDGGPRGATTLGLYGVVQLEVGPIMARSLRIIDRSCVRRPGSACSGALVNKPLCQSGLRVPRNQIEYGKRSSGYSSRIRDGASRLPPASSPILRMIPFRIGCLHSFSQQYTKYLCRVLPYAHGNDGLDCEQTSIPLSRPLI